MPETITIDVQGAVARVMLNRPDVNNAMNAQMVEDLISAFETMPDHVRAVVIGAEGKAFCVGGDFKDLARLGTSEAQQHFAERFDHMLTVINHTPQVTVARLHGAVMGGGFGLMCVTDVSIAASDAVFALPEVRVGMSPALISPYVIERIGLARARQMMLTGQRMDAVRAHRYGFIHEVCTASELDNQVQATVNDILQCAPDALAETKALIQEVKDKPPAETLAYRADLLNRLRGGEEGQEGMQAFLEKRKPRWAEDTPHP